MINKPIQTGDRLFLIDGSGFIFRAYHALPPLTRTSDNLPIGAVSGFCNMLFKLTEELKAGDQPTHIAVIFDASSKTFRNDIYSKYKANRPPPPEDLVPQFALCREASRAFGIEAIEMLGYEADDLIASYAKQASIKGAEVRIYSSDKDLMQLINDKVILVDPLKNKFLGHDASVEKFGVPPHKIPFVQALSGDSVDNIPGVPGIGIKTAALLIQEFGDLEGLLANVAQIPQKKRRENLIEFSDMARLSYQLVTLKDDIKGLTVSIDDMGFCEPELEKVTDFLQRMELRTLLKRVTARHGSSSQNIQREIDEKINSEQQKKHFPTDLFADPQQMIQSKAIDTTKYKLITTETDLKVLINQIEETGHFVFDLETTGLNIVNDKIAGIAISISENHGVYIPLGHDAGEQLNKTSVLNSLKPYFESNQFLKIAHNIKFDASFLLQEGINLTTYDDTMLMSYSLYGGKHRHNMDLLAELYLSHYTISYEEVVGKGKNQKTFNQITPQEALNYAAEDAEVTYRLWIKFKHQLLSGKQNHFYQTIERKMPLIARDMEIKGFSVNRNLLKTLSNDFDLESNDLSKKIFFLAGEEFNIASPKQIGDILFNKLGINSDIKRKKTSSGQAATGADILEDLTAEGNEIAELILKWRGLQKLKSTYCDALQSHINPTTKRIHSSFNLTGAATGRFSSSDPNLQNIPIRTQEGRKIRQAFIAQDGYTILALDYSQIELRLLAHIADVQVLKDSFQNKQDIHTRTAAEVFGISLNQVTNDIRRKAKAVNFGIIYGISAFGLARQLKISQSEAKEYIDTYFKRLPEVKEYMQNITIEARDKGYVKTIFGRKIWIKDINSKNYTLRSFSERAAINAPIQGAAADLIKLSMIDYQNSLKQKYNDCFLLSQVHDELLFEVPNYIVEKFSRDIKNIMQKASLNHVDLTVPIDVEIGIGKNWDQAH